MLSKEQKLEAIYEAMADKTLINGCILLIGGFIYTMGNASYDGDYIKTGGCGCGAQYYDEYEYTIIGHPVHIGDVLDYWDFEGTEYALLNLWENKRLPIDAQSEECIDFVYSLIN